MRLSLTLTTLLLLTPLTSQAQQPAAAPAPPSPRPPSPEPARLGDCAPATAARQETPMGLGGSLLVHCEAHGVLYVLYAYRGPGGAEVESLGDGLRLQ